MKHINNCETGEIIVREMTDEEIAAEQASALSYASVIAAEEAKFAAKELARTKLEALGLTIDDLKALGL